MRSFIILVFISLLASSCEKIYYEGPEDQPVFFEYHYTNYAWGVADNGWLINQEGEIRGFDFPQDYRYADSEGQISIEDLEYNLSQADTLLQSLSRKEFEKHARLIQGASDGNLGERKNRGADMGSASLVCYAYDTETGNYAQVILGVTGDWEQFNLSNEAEKLVDWLKELEDVAFFD